MMSSEPGLDDDARRDLDDLHERLCGALQRSPSIAAADVDGRTVIVDTDTLRDLLDALEAA